MDLKLLTISDIAPVLGAAESTLYDKVSSGELPCIRLWAGKRKSAIRFTEDMLRDFLKSKTQPVRKAAR